jgi:hypothetical protein
MTNEEKLSLSIFQKTTVKNWAGVGREERGVYKPQPVVSLKSTTSPAHRSSMPDNFVNRIYPVSYIQL